MNIADMNVLVVDDFAAMRHNVRGLLQELGCKQVGEAEDGAVALQILKKQRYDFVVCDIHMPNMNGFDLLHALSADLGLKHLPVLMVTSEARKEDILLASQRGAAGYIVKPFTKGGLQQKLQMILNRRAGAA